MSEYLFDHAARAALALAGVPVERQQDILRELAVRLDREVAIRRRNYWFRQAYDLIGHEKGSLEILANALADYHARVWPRRWHAAEPSATDSPLHRAFFFACQAAADAGAPIPGPRQIRRLVS
jgi:hypothetical protein